MKMKSGDRPGAKKSGHNSAKVMKRMMKMAQAKKGNPVQLPKKRGREDALEELQLSKAIDKANEQKMAAKLIQAGGRMSTKDLMQRGKELNKETRRNQVKKKLTRVEEKLQELKAKADEEG